MPDLIIKPTNTSGNKVIIQDQAGGAVLTTADSGATFSGGNIGTVTAGNLSHADIVYPAMAKVGTFSRAVAGTPGDVSYTGVGFQPSVIHFVAGIQDGTSRSWGMDDGTTHLCLMTQYTAHTSGTPGANTDNKSIYVHYSATLGTKAIVKTMDSDGFTLTWYDIGDPSTGTVVVMYTAFR